MNTSLFFEATCGLLFLINKIALLFLSKEKRKWIWIPVIPGAFIALWMYLGNQPKLWALAIIQIVGLLLTVRAMIAPKERSKNFERGVMIITMIAIPLALYMSYAPGVSIADGISAVVFTVGTTLFGYETLMKKQFAWILYLVGHIIGAYLAKLQGFYFFAGTQIVSAGIAYAGIIVTQWQFTEEYSLKNFPDD